uniref:Uncharacterized protein n=1 Tax=Astatotilapia calliptera TaxID=8154 RepID=A0AAX7U1F6_ASTCA
NELSDFLFSLQLDHPNKPPTEPGSVRRGRRGNASSKILEPSFVTFLLEESACRADRAAYSGDLCLKTFPAVFCTLQLFLDFKIQACVSSRLCNMHF